MYKKKFVKIILFFFITYSNLLNCKNVTKNAEISLAESSYFEENKWDFIDNLVIRYPNQVQFDYGYISLFISFFIGAFSGKIVFDAGNHKNLFAAIIVAILSGYITKKITQKLITNNSYNNKIFKVLKWFMSNYNPDLNVNSKKNFKKFIPQELQNTFDNMYLEYIRFGDKYLKDIGIEIIYEIRKKIMYEIKVEEYRKPNVVNINSSSHSKASQLAYNYNIYK